MSFWRKGKSSKQQLQYYSAVKFHQLKKLTELIIDEYEELAHLYANANIGIALVDCDLRFLRINKVLAEINGYSVDAHIGKTLHDILNNVDVYDQIVECYDSVIKTGDAITNYLIQGQIGKSGKRRWLCSYYPFLRKGEVTAVSSIVIELTPVCRLCRQLD